MKVYTRPNVEEVKNPAIIRYVHKSLFLILSSPPVILEKTVVHLIHNCLRFLNQPDARLE